MKNTVRISDGLISRHLEKLPRATFVIENVPVRSYECMNQFALRHYVDRTCQTCREGKFVKNSMSKLDLCHASESIQPYMEAYTQSCKYNTRTDHKMKYTCIFS